MTEKQLLLHFEDAFKKKVTISVDRPKATLTEAQIKAVTDIIVSKNIFEYNGASIVSATGAEIVETNTTAFDLAL